MNKAPLGYEITRLQNQVKDFEWKRSPYRIYESPTMKYKNQDSFHKEKDKKRKIKPTINQSDYPTRGIESHKIGPGFSSHGQFPLPFQRQ